MRYIHHDSPIGPLLLAGADALAILRWPGQPPNADWREDHNAFQAARQQLDAYFTNAKSVFDVPLAPAGSAFQQRVWQALQAIPPGKTASYAEIAAAIDQPKAAQAVGQANGANPIPIIIPCHRVIAANGGIGGFSGSMAHKRDLLSREGVIFQDETPRLI